MGNRYYIFRWRVYSRETLAKAKRIKIYFKDEDDEGALVKDKYGRLWLFYTRWEKLHDNQETYYSLVRNEEEARNLLNQEYYWERHKCPCFSMSSYDMFRLGL